MGRDKVTSVDRHKRSVNKFTSEDRWFSAIGRFIFEFSQLEATLKYYVAHAINLQDRHFNSIMTQDFSMLCTIAETVLLREQTKMIFISCIPVSLSIPAHALSRMRREAFFLMRSNTTRNSKL